MSRATTAIAIAFLSTATLLPPAIGPTGSRFLSTVAHASEPERPVPQITITGEASVNVAPDLAIVDMGVLREAKTAREALDANNAAMAEVIAAMKEAGIAAKDLQTSGFSIQPRYVYHNPKQGERQKPPHIVGYTVSNNLTVRVRDLTKVGDVLDRSVSLGVNNGGSIRFGNDDPKAEIAKARAAAMKDAIDRATVLLEAAGATLGPIMSIQEGYTQPVPVPMARGKMMADAVMAEAVPVEAGENTYTVTVSVTWEIKQ